MPSTWAMRMNVVVALAAFACSETKSGSSDLPAEFPLPAGGTLRTGADAVHLPGEKAVEYEYAGKQPAELADELRAGFQKNGWTITWDKVEGGRYFVSAKRGAVSVDTVASRLEKTSLSIRVRSKQAPGEAAPGDSKKNEAGSPTPPAPAAGPPPGWPAKFPFVGSGGTRDPGYPPTPGERSEFLYIFKAEQPDAVADRARAEASRAGYLCTDGPQFTCLMQSDGSQVSVSAKAFPEGGTALFVHVMPDLPAELR